MPLAAGARLGPYEIVSAVGAGGMGEVYRGRDTRLDRTVAIKILRAELSLNPQHRERLLREARAVSHLNHPHICTLHDIGSASGIDYLLMEYIDGTTLQQRLMKGALSRDEALRYGIEIADALDRAHRQQIVHRDLKPGNIMLTRSGAKILDFGLAKIGVGVAQGGDDATMTRAVTAEGAIVGTLQYMAPEQLEGKDASPLADIFALGVVLYEMLSGHRPFSGSTPASLIAGILTAEPPPAPGIPGGSSLDRVVRKCLAKNPDRRWQTASDLRDELEWIASGAAAPAAVTAPPRRGFMHFGGAAAALVLAVLTGWFAGHQRREPSAAAAWNFAVSPPEGTAFAFNARPGAMAISPDSHWLVFPVLTSDGSQLWLRDLSSGSEKPLAGTEDGHEPFWSPDSRQVGFFGRGKLKKVGLSGSPEVICNAGTGRNGSWNRDGVIVFTPRSLSVIHRVAAAGGEPRPITTLDPARHENAHYWPYFLPDGRHFLYWARNTDDHQRSGIFIASLDDAPALAGRPLLVATPMGAVFSSSPDGTTGHLLYIRGNSLVAQAFDPTRMLLSGEPMRVVDEFSSPDGIRAGVSAARVLVYAEPESPASRLVWKSRAGTPLGEAAAPGDYQGIRLSPDGRRIAAARQEPEIGANVWSIGPSGGMTKLTLDPSHARDSPVWSPDGLRIAFSDVFQSRAFSLFTVSSSGSRSERLSVTTMNQASQDWSPDGRYLVYRQISPATQEDLWVLPLQSSAHPFAIINTPFQETFGRVSPDGRWIAYNSDESGASEVYVQSFAALVAGGRSSPRWAVSTRGGSEPIWRRDGKELFYRATNGAFFSATVESAGEQFRTGTPKLLFEAWPSIYTGVLSSYDVSPDGTRLIVAEPLQRPGSRPLRVVTDWLAAQKLR